MAKQPWYLSMSPDGYSRYEIMHRVVSAFQKGSKTIRILDAGGSGTRLPDYLDTSKTPYTYTIIDILPPQDKDKRHTYVQGSATEMPFKDNEFDIVVSTDTLEHIPDDGKKLMVEESIRVAKTAILLQAPFDSEATDYAEQLANDFYRKLTGHDHHWLAEHFEEHKPKKSMIEQILKKKLLPYLYFESNALANWVEMVTLNFVAEVNPDVLDEVRELNTFYNENLFRIGDIAAPGYRQHFLILKDRSLKTDLGSLVDYQFDVNCALEFQIQKNAALASLLSKFKIYQEITPTILSQFDSHLQEEVKYEEQMIQEMNDTFTKVTGTTFYKGWQAYNTIKKKLGFIPELE